MVFVDEYDTDRGQNEMFFHIVANKKEMNAIWKMLMTLYKEGRFIEDNEMMKKIIDGMEEVVF